jgi:hypothetical protein
MSKAGMERSRRMEARRHANGSLDCVSAVNGRPQTKSFQLVVFQIAYADRGPSGSIAR